MIISEAQSLFKNNKMLDKIQTERTYEMVNMLICICDTICPKWAEKRLNRLIGQCFDRLPNTLEITIFEENN